MCCLQNLFFQWLSLETSICRMLVIGCYKVGHNDVRCNDWLGVHVLMIMQYYVSAGFLVCLPISHQEKNTLAQVRCWTCATIQFLIYRFSEWDCIVFQTGWTTKKYQWIKNNKMFLSIDILFLFIDVFLMGDSYPPKLSKRIMSSSTPSEWRRSSTVFAIIGGPQR